MRQDIRICFVGDSFVNGTGDEAALGWAGRPVCCRQCAQHTCFLLQPWDSARHEQRYSASLEERMCPAAARFLRWSRSHLVWRQRYGHRERGGSSRISLRPARTCDRSCAAQAIHRAYGGSAARHRRRTERKNQKRSRLPLLARHKRLESRISISFLLFARMMPIKREVSRNDGSHPRGEGYSKMAHICRFVAQLSDWQRRQKVKDFGFFVVVLQGRSWRALRGFFRPRGEYSTSYVNCVSSSWSAWEVVSLPGQRAAVRRMAHSWLPGVDHWVLRSSGSSLPWPGDRARPSRSSPPRRRGLLRTVFSIHGRVRGGRRAQPERSAYSRQECCRFRGIPHPASRRARGVVYGGKALAMHDVYLNTRTHEELFCSA